MEEREASKGQAVEEVRDGGREGGRDVTFWGMIFLCLGEM